MKTRSYLVTTVLLMTIFFISCNETNKSAKIPNTATTVEATEEVKLSPAKQEVLDAVLRLHDGMRKKDGNLAASAWLETASSYNINIDSLGQINKVLDNPKVNIEGIRTWLNSTKDDLNEEIFNVEIFIDGDLAMAWVPYNFYRNNAFSHSGTNAFTLVKLENIWKIVSVTDTRYFDKTKAYKQ